MEDIKYSEDPALFSRALTLFTSKKVTMFELGFNCYRAVVLGSQPYQVSVATKAFDYADCNCYMGQNDMLCKHALAVALEALYRAGQIDKAGNKLGQQNQPANDQATKLQINAGFRRIKPYRGPSKIWFSYQRELSIGSGIILEAAAQFEPSRSNAKYLWQLVLRLSKKLSTGGVDDSDGTVGGCCTALVAILNRWANKNQVIKQMLSTFHQHKTGFGFEDELAD